MLRFSKLFEMIVGWSEKLSNEFKNDPTWNIQGKYSVSHILRMFLGANPFDGLQAARNLGPGPSEIKKTC